VRIETTTICGTDLHIPKGDVPAVQPGRILGHEGVLEGVTPEAGTLLSDILPTGHEIGVQYGAVKPGDVVAVVGAGPVGLAAITTAGLYGPARIIAIDVAGTASSRRNNSEPRTASCPQMTTGKIR
jgi:threonine dehydrogenase-like Zn-dependent dehydrogenase